MKGSIGIYNTQKACMFSYLVREKQSLINVRINYSICMCDKSISSAAAVHVYNMYTIVQRELLKNPFEEAEKKEGFL